MINNTLSPAAYQALKACIAKAGPNKGSLVGRAPSYGKDAAANAAWNGAMMSINPFKVSIMMLMLASAENKAIFEEVKTFFDANPCLKHMDKDRSALERLGVW